MKGIGAVICIFGVDVHDKGSINRDNGNCQYNEQIAQRNAIYCKQ